jgi:hypothetical protein
MPDEVNAGLEFLRGILRPPVKLRLKSVKYLFDRDAYYLVFAMGDKEHTILLSMEFLHDLPNTREYQTEAYTYVRSLEGRMENFCPFDFYCNLGIPLEVRMKEWAGRVQDRDATFAHVYVNDIRVRDSIAKCSVIITGQQYVFDLEQNSFRREPVIMNTIRNAVDKQQLLFFTSDTHPSQLQLLELNTEPMASASASTLQDFLAGKVYWLGFKRGDKRTQAWIADPWDAEYLGVKTNALIQAAQILHAQEMIVLDSTHEFATAGESLLREAARFEAPITYPIEVLSGRAGTEAGRRRWDVFICHASEDKDNFARPLAEGLRREGLSVWFDEFTLKVGDSLRRSIDHGLGYSRFGVVVLSPAFFAKE